MPQLTHQSLAQLLALLKEAKQIEGQLAIPPAMFAAVGVSSYIHTLGLEPFLKGMYEHYGDEINETLFKIITIFLTVCCFIGIWPTFRMFQGVFQKILPQGIVYGLLGRHSPAPALVLLHNPTLLAKKVKDVNSEMEKYIGDLKGRRYDPIYLLIIFITIFSILMTFFKMTQDAIENISILYYLGLISFAATRNTIIGYAASFLAAWWRNRNSAILATQVQERLNQAFRPQGTAWALCSLNNNPSIDTTIFYIQYSGEQVEIKIASDKFKISSEVYITELAMVLRGMEIKLLAIEEEHAYYALSDLQGILESNITEVQEGLRQLRWTPKSIPQSDLYKRYSPVNKSSNLNNHYRFSLATTIDLSRGFVTQ